MKTDALSLWRKLSRFPLGERIFSSALCFRAPYFRSIKPLVTELRPGYSEVRVRKRRAVQNHIGTVHAIASCNAAELVAGTLIEVTLPASHRWIPVGMSVDYLKKAATDLRAVAELPALPELGDDATDVPITVRVLDTSGTAVVQAVITMRVSPKR